MFSLSFPFSLIRQGLMVLLFTNRKENKLGICFLVVLHIDEFIYLFLLLFGLESAIMDAFLWQTCHNIETSQLLFKFLILSSKWRCCLKNNFYCALWGSAVPSSLTAFYMRGWSVFHTSWSSSDTHSWLALLSLFRNLTWNVCVFQTELKYSLYCSVCLKTLFSHGI